MIKHTLKRRRVLPMILASFLLLLIGGVIAYDNDIFTADNKFYVNDSIARTTEVFTPPEDWKTCDEVPKTVVTTNDHADRIQVRLSYDEYWRNKADTENLPLIKDGERLAIINFQNEHEWELKNDGWYYWKGELAPGESTDSLLKSVTYNCNSNMGATNVCHETATGTVCEKPDDPYDEAVYHLVVHVEISQNDFPGDKYYNVSVDPYGGTFNGSGDVYVDRVVEGTQIDLSNIARDGYDFRGWKKNDEEELYTNSTITINADTALSARWYSNITHTVTVDPNGGTYDNSSEPSQYTVHDDDDFTIGEATRPTYTLDHWETLAGDIIDGNVLRRVTEDITIKAIWSKAVARIERTGVIYPSIMDAEAEAINGDTITLLVDTEEVVTNEKTVTLDLGGHTVTGSLTNTAAGNITLINGEINNPNGAAVTNNGTLTMGVNDYNDDSTAHIVHDYIRLIGTTSGIDQNGTFNYYDGFIEGLNALDGGYDDSPVYHNTFDDIDVKYFPFIEYRVTGSDVQHVSLASSDNAVSKTIVGGEIYYYNLQDNIKASAQTGYKIYIVRDFSASYPIEVPANKIIEIDLVGFTVTTNDTLTNNGTLSIEDSEYANSTYAGAISNQYTFVNNGDLTITNAKISSTGTGDTIQNNDSLTMRNGLVTASKGYAMQPVSGATYDLDATSKLESTNSNYPAVYNSISDFVWTSGIIKGGLKNANIAGVTATINGGTIQGGSVGITNNNSANSKVIINDGTISGTTGVLGRVVMNGGTINTGYIGIDATDTSSMNGGTINIGNVLSGYSNYAPNCGIDLTRDGTFTFDITGGTINVSIEGTNTTTKAAGICYNSKSRYNIKYLNLTGGTITASNVSGESYGIYSNSTSSISDSAHISYDGATINASSTNNTSYGIYLGNTDNHAHAFPNYLDVKILSGKVQGGTYGMYLLDNYHADLGDASTAVSTSDPEIIGGSYALYGGGTYQFFDGVLRAGVHTFQDGKISATATDTSVHTESSASYAENSWLVAEEGYLQVSGTTYNSLGAAYDAITGDTGTIYVIKDATIASALAESPANKNITFDINGHQLTYTQPLTNNSNFTIVDSSTGQVGALTIDSIVNYASLTFRSGRVNGGDCAVESYPGSTVTVNGGNLYADGTAIYNTYNDSHSGSSSIYTTNNISSGSIHATSNGISSSYNYTNINITGGSIVAEYTDMSQGSQVRGINQKSNVSISGDGAIIVNNTNGSAWGVDGATVTMLSGRIEVSASHPDNPYQDAHGIEGNVTMSGGSIVARNTGYGAAYGIYSRTNGTATITGGSITVSATRHSASGISNTKGTVDFQGGTIQASSAGGNSYGINGGKDANHYAEINVSGGTIISTSTSTSSSNTGYGIAAYNGAITGGTIHGSTYGLSTPANGQLTIGNDDGNVSITSPEIIGDDTGVVGNSFLFYDGVIRGKNKAYQDGVITGIASGTEKHIESSADYAENCWLLAAANYLEVAGVQFNNLNDAYNAITGNTGTIKVIADVSIDAVHPASPDNKTITFDLNGHELEYSQPIIVSPTTNMTVIDSDTTNYAGKLKNESAVVPLITNNGTLTVASGTLDSAYRTINNTIGSTLNITGGKLSSSNTVVYSEGSSSQNVNVNFSGGSVEASPSGEIKYGFYNKNGYENINMTGNSQISINRTAQTNYRQGTELYGVYAGKSLSMSDNAKITVMRTPIETADSALPATSGTGGSIKNVTLDDNATVIVKNGDRVGNDTIGVYGRNVTINENSNVLVKTTVTGTYDTAKGISASSSLTMKSGSIEVISEKSTNNTVAVGATVGSSVVNITGGTITVTGSNNASGLLAVDNNTSAQNVTINVTTEGKAAGVKVQNCSSQKYTLQATVTNSNITVTGTGDKDAFGVDGCSTTSDTYNANATVNGTNITVTSASGAAYGVYASNNIITGQTTIDAGTYGVYNKNNGATIGVDDGNVSTTYPEIKGGEYSIYGQSTSFYDGILKGAIDSYIDGAIIAIASNHFVNHGQEAIDGVNFQTAWLAPPDHYVARINNTQFYWLTDAIAAAATSGDTIVLIDQNFIYNDPVVFPANKEITVDMNGYNIITGTSITNNGTTKFTNSQFASNNPTINSPQPIYLFVNNANASLELENIKISAVTGVDNAGTLTINNTQVESRDTSINNTGILQLVNASILSQGTAINTTGNVRTDQNNTIGAAEYAVYANGGEAIFESMSIDGKVYVNSGKVSLANSTIGFSTNKTIAGLMTTKTGTELILDNVTSTLDVDYNDGSYSSRVDYIVNNAGTFSANDSIFNIVPHNSTSIQLNAINNSGTANLFDINVSIASGASPYVARGINTTGGTTYLRSGIVNMDRGSSSAYGIYAAGGTTVIGVPEDPNSGHYGDITADVSTTNPSIISSGYGSYKESGGATIEFYDGKITGKTGAFNVDPNIVEYLYEVKNYTDTNNYYYAILEWIRPTN